VIAGVILAAGESRRMGRSKPLVRRRGETFLAHGVRLLWTQCDCVVVVLGKEGARVRREAEEEFARLASSGALGRDLTLARHGRGHKARLEVHFVENRAYRRGMLTSARLGIATALRLKPDAMLLTLVDHPSVRPETVRALGSSIAEAMKAYAPGRGTRATPGLAYAIVPRVGGRRGHPVALSTALARAIANDHDGESLSDSIRRNARLIGYLDVADRGIIANVNAPRGRRG